MTNFVQVHMLKDQSKELSLAVFPAEQPIVEIQSIDITDKK